MSDERKQELQEAYQVLVAENLYRRGKCEFEHTGYSVTEFGEAIDAAAGAILDYLADDKEFVMQNAIDKDLIKRLQETQKENLRLKALLAGNKIKYRKGKEE